MTALPGSLRRVLTDLAYWQPANSVVMGPVSILLQSSLSNASASCHAWPLCALLAHTLLFQCEYSRYGMHGMHLTVAASRTLPLSTGSRTTRPTPARCGSGMGEMQDR